MWNKIFDIPVYFAATGLFVYGVLGIVNNDPVAEGENGPGFYIVCALFVVMFIFGNRRYRKFQERIDENEDPK